MLQTQLYVENYSCEYLSTIFLTSEKETHYALDRYGKICQKKKSKGTGKLQGSGFIYLRAALVCKIPLLARALATCDKINQMGTLYLYLSHRLFGTPGIQSKYTGSSLRRVSHYVARGATFIHYSNDDVSFTTVFIRFAFYSRLHELLYQ